MRLFALLATLAFAAASAGCLGGGAPDADPTPTSPGPAVEPSPEPVTQDPTPEPTPEPTPATPTPTPEPEPPQPKTIANHTFDFATEGDATGQAPKSKPTDAVPEGYGNLSVTITFTRTNEQLPVSGSVNAPTIRLLDPGGNEALLAKEDSVPAPGTLLPAVPGAWTVRYEGSGTLKATVEIRAVA